MSSNNSRYRRSLFLGLSISILLLVVLLSQVQLKQSWHALTGLNLLSLLMPLVMTFASLTLRPWRWRAIFPRAVRPDFWHCFRVFAIGSMANNVLPGRGGDLMRCFLITGSRSLSAAGLTVGTLAIEKILDGLALLVIVLIWCFFLSPPQWLVNVGQGASVILTGGVAVILLLRFRFDWCTGWIRWLFNLVRLPSLGEKINGLLGKLVQGLAAVDSRRQMANALFLTWVIWSGETILVWGLAAALYIPLSFSGAAVVSAIVGLGLMVPSAPGFIGTYEFFSITALSLFGIEKEKALALSLLMHSWTFIMVSLLGLISLAISGIRFSTLVDGRPQQQTSIAHVLNCVNPVISDSE